MTAQIVIQELIVGNTLLCFYGAAKAYGKDPMRLLYCTVAAASGGVFGFGALSVEGTVIAQAIGLVYGIIES